MNPFFPKNSTNGELLRVLGSKTGVVKTLGHLYRNADDPSPHIVTSNITAFHRFSGNKADFASTGTSLSPERAHWSALGESVERYCAALSDFQPLVFGSYKKLTGKGHNVLHPNQFTLFSPGQYAKEGFPFSPPTTDSPLTWIMGRSLIDGAEYLIPACFVFNQFRPAQGEIRICPDIHPGVASGPSLRRVLTGALLEIVERDSMMIHWLNSLPVTGITCDAEHAKLLHRFSIPKNIHLHLAFLQNDLDIPCVFALLLDEKNGLLGGGCSAGFQVARAAEKAVCEAIQILRLSREVQRGKKGKLAFKKGALPEAFLDAEARKDLPLTELLYNLGFYLDTANWYVLGDLITPFSRVSLKDLEREPPPDELQFLIDKFFLAGLQPICIDVTTPDVDELGWLVMRVVAPGAIPNLATAYTPTAMPRLRSMPGKIGLTPSERLNTLPMPYA